MPPLYHGLYTNAFGQRGQGFRHLFLAPEWPPADRQRIGRWLETLRPSAEPGERVAVNGFRIGPTIHACLARVDADFARDEHGRGGGVLVHALLVPLAEGRPAGDFTSALLAKSREIERPETADADRLETYLDRCREVRETELPSVDAAAVRSLGEDFLRRCYSSFLAGAREVVFERPATPLAAALATAAAAVPPRLRLGCRWAVGLRPTPETSFVARAAADGERPPPPAGGPGTAYARWLYSRPAPEVMESWDVRSWDALMEWIRSRP